MGGGDSNNVNWVGTWNRVVANGWPAPLNSYLCKAGLRSGTNCGYGTSTGTAQSQGYSSPVMYAYGQFGDCMSAGGDSGAPIMIASSYQNLGTDTTMAGMLIVGHGQISQAGPGNDCYGPLGSPITYYYGFITEETIRDAFSAFQLQSVQWD